MFCLYYESKQERAQALISIARQCGRQGADFTFFGSKSDCATARKSLRPFAAPSLPDVTFRRLDLAAEIKTRRALNAAMAAFRTALLELLTGDRRMVVWIESPLVFGGAVDREAVHVFRETLSSLTTRDRLSIINAYRFADLVEDLRADLLEVAEAVVSAKAILRGCPPWLIDQGESGTDGGADPTSPGDAAITGQDLRPQLQAERLSAVGQLAAGIVHELGNPLAIISSSLQFLQQRFVETNDPAGEFVLLALKNVERMQGYLQSALGFARAKELHFEQTDLRENIAEVLRFTAWECGQREVIVEVNFDPTLPKISGDPSGIKQVLLNAVINALDAMADRGGLLQVRTRRVSAGGLAVVDISNNGPLIAPQVLRRLFQPFFTTKKMGTGLGLYLSRTIAIEHGGDIGITNLSNGVRFTLTLPLGQSERNGNGRDTDR
jgi:signal transduction histidine kinase